MRNNNDAMVNGAGTSRITRLSVAANGRTRERNELNFSVPPCLCGEKDRK
jgi:hypothetical protein